MTMREREGIIDMDASYRSKRKLHSTLSHHGIGVPDEWGGFPIIDTKSIAESENKLPRQPDEDKGEKIYNLDEVRAYHPRSHKGQIFAHRIPLGSYPIDSFGEH